MSIFKLVQMGIDLFDTSYATQMTEESKAFRVMDSYAYDGKFETIDLTEER
jgi:queuine/archaeosine tRNA-ribosyltransferase